MDIIQLVNKNKTANMLYFYIYRQKNTPDNV